MKGLLIFFVITCSGWLTCSGVVTSRTVGPIQEFVENDSIGKQLVRSQDSFLSKRLLSGLQRAHRVPREDDDEEEVVEVDAEEKVEESKIVESTDESADESEDEKEKGFRKKLHGWLKLATGIYVFICVVLSALALGRYAMDGCPCMQLQFI